jgi:DNA helicase HerA-like ATPase
LSNQTITLSEAAREIIGTVTAVSTPSEFQFQINADAKKPLLQDFVVVPHPMDDSKPVLSKIIRLSRFNPLLPDEAALELAKLSIDPALSPLPLYGKMEMNVAACQVLGSLDEAKKLRSPGFPVKPGSLVRLPTPSFMELALGGVEEYHRLELGALRNRDDISVSVDANEILNKHLAILAMTGSGKTYAASVLLEELIKKGYPLLVLDPHGDYIRLGELSNGQRLKFRLQNGVEGEYKLTVFDRAISITELDKESFISFVEGLSEEEITAAQRGIYSDAFDYYLKENKPGLSGLYEYVNKKQAQPDRSGKQAKLNPSDKAILRQLNSVRRLLSGVDSTLRVKEIQEAIGPGKGVVLNMSNLPAQVQRVTAMIVLEELFEKRKRYVIGAEKEQECPLFIVVEEAHNFAPFQEEDGVVPTRSILRRIATEGRKFGFGLCVISQRPSRLDPTVLSQCNSQIILKILNPNDQTYIRQTVESLAMADLLALPDLSQGEALLSGAMIPVPSLVKIRRRQSLEGIPARDRLQELTELSELM